MRFRTGVAVGLGIGFVIGIEVGHRRYDQVQDFLERLGKREPVRSVAGVGQDLLDGIVEAGKESLGNQMRSLSQRVLPGD